MVNLLFDTTASNTGHHISTACVTLQQAIGRPLLWSACRHHIGEVIIGHVFNDLKIETSRSPEITVFNRLRGNFHLVHKHNEKKLSNFDSSSYTAKTQILIQYWKEQAVMTARSPKQYQRDDYQELSQLCLLYLEGTDQEFTFRRPSAIHRAR